MIYPLLFLFVILSFIILRYKSDTYRFILLILFSVSGLFFEKNIFIGIYIIFATFLLKVLIDIKKYQEKKNYEFSSAIYPLNEKLTELNKKIEMLDLKKTETGTKLNNIWNIYSLGHGITSCLEIEKLFKILNSLLSSCFSQKIKCLALFEFNDKNYTIKIISDEKLKHKIEHYISIYLNWSELTVFQTSFDDTLVTYFIVKTTKQQCGFVINSTYDIGKDIYDFGRNIYPLLSMGLQRCLLYEEVQKLARHDGLTGLFLRRYFMELVDDEIMRISRYGGYFTILMLDIDNFKSVNDTYGHLIGDKFLMLVAQIIKSSVRTIDLPARYGGEEFIVLFPNLKIDLAYRYADEIRKKIENTKFIFQNIEINRTISGGLACYPYDANSIDVTIRKADERLYIAKSQGKNCIVM